MSSQFISIHISQIHDIFVFAGFDPFRVSTIALQDLIESESSSHASTPPFKHQHSAPSTMNNLHEHKQPPPPAPRALPPGFAPNLINNSFTHHLPRKPPLCLLAYCRSICCVRTGHLFVLQCRV